MKKLFFAAIIAVFTMTSMSAQTFGVTAGYQSTILSVSATSIGGSSTAATSKGGFYAGAFAEMEISDILLLRGDVLYTAVENANSIRIPITLGYAINDNFKAYVGPSANIILEDMPDDAKTFYLGITANIAYDFTDNIFANAGYDLGVTSIADNDYFSTKMNAFFIGVGYKFN